MTLTGLTGSSMGVRHTSLRGYFEKLRPDSKSASMSLSEDNLSCLDSVYRAMACQKKDNFPGRGRSSIDQNRKMKMYSGWNASKLLHSHGVRYRQLVTTTGATGRHDLAASLGAHPATKTMFVDFFSAAGLKCPFHRYTCLLFEPLISKRAQMYLIFLKNGLFP